jgi:hypothetical protein
MKKSFKSCAAVGFAAALSAGCLLYTAAPALASNSSDAKLCQKLGWQLVATATGDSFKNQGNCVSYAARGGQFQGACLDTAQIWADGRLTAPLDTLNNLSVYRTGDGSCGAGIQAFQTIVGADDATTANVKCVTLDANGVAQQFANYGYAVPSNWWICQRTDYTT